MKVKSVVADTPSDSALLICVRHLICLTFDTYRFKLKFGWKKFWRLILWGRRKFRKLTWVHDMISANGTVVNVNIYYKNV